VRIVGNRYPALAKTAVLEREYHGLVRRISGVGYHEVIVESPTHNTCAALETPACLTRVFQAFIDRAWQVQLDPRIEYIQFFKNHGRQAGASLRHPHAQMMALPMVPSDVRVRADTARMHFDEVGGCAYCEMLEQERADGRRIVLESEHFVVFSPYAAFSPFHLWVVPKTHAASFLHATPAEVEDLGKRHAHDPAQALRRAEQPRFQLRDSQRAGARPGRALSALVHHHRPAHFAGRRLRAGQRHLHQPVAAGRVRQFLRNVDESTLVRMRSDATT
jgi:galactose-1-phosphate uridylyltransferase